jgi:hypothetical protein
LFRNPKKAAGRFAKHPKKTCVYYYENINIKMFA